jgi:hypothetical protein
MSLNYLLFFAKLTECCGEFMNYATIKQNASSKLCPAPVHLSSPSVTVWLFFKQHYRWRIFSLFQWLFFVDVSFGGQNWTRSTFDMVDGVVVLYFKTRQQRTGSNISRIALFWASSLKVSNSIHKHLFYGHLHQLVWLSWLYIFKGHIIEIYYQHGSG